MPAKLKPCPFCGQNVVMTETPLRDARTGETTYRYEVECPCGLSFVVKLATVEEAVYRWNRRANDAVETQP